MGDQLLPHGLTVVAEVFYGEVRLCQEWTAATFDLPERDPRDMAGGRGDQRRDSPAVLEGERGRAATRS